MSVARQKMFLFFAADWKLNVFLSRTIVFKFLKLVKSLRIKISNYTNFLIALKILIIAWDKDMWQHFWSKPSILSLVWKVAILNSGEAFLPHTKTSRLKGNRGRYLNILGYSVLR